MMGLNCLDKPYSLQTRLSSGQEDKKDEENKDFHCKSDFLVEVEVTAGYNGAELTNGRRERSFGNILSFAFCFCGLSLFFSMPMLSLVVFCTIVGAAIVRFTVKASE